MARFPRAGTACAAWVEQRGGRYRGGHGAVHHRTSQRDCGAARCRGQGGPRTGRRLAAPAEPGIGVPALDGKGAARVIALHHSHRAWFRCAATAGALALELHPAGGVLQHFRRHFRRTARHHAESHASSWWTKTTAGRRERLVKGLRSEGSLVVQNAAGAQAGRRATGVHRRDRGGRGEGRGCARGADHSSRLRRKSHFVRRRRRTVPRSDC